MNEAPSTSKPQKEKKLGHRRVDAATGLTTYKKTPSSALSQAIQLGISHTVGGIISKPERDVLLQDFQVVETTLFPSEGSSITPAHHYDDFRFKTYAPIAFRYFRDLFGILPEDFMISISAEPLTELSNPGASGSLFFVTHDDEFIIKTVQHKEAEFLQKLLPGYYMNLVQNPRTLLPKFYGLYCIQAGGKNIRMVVMNNLLPRHLKMHLKFDLKGSTFKRKASKYEREKKSPTFKDLDMLSDMPEGIVLEPDIYAAFIKTMQRDCLVLRSFKIMDYSLLLGIHYEKSTKDEKGEENEEKRRSNSSDSSEVITGLDTLRRPRNRKDPSKRNTPTDSIMSSTLLRDKYTTDLDLWSGGIPAQSVNGEKMLLFCGLIDILQCYKLKKKMEHTFKSMVYDADSVSVHRPGFYCDRFQKFMSEHVFKKAPAPIKTQPTKRRTQTARRPLDGNGAAPSPGIPTSTSRSRTPPSQSGKRLQSDRPDLLPSESPRPVNLDQQGEDSDTHTHQHAASRTPLRMKMYVDERPSSYTISAQSQESLQQIVGEKMQSSLSLKESQIGSGDIKAEEVKIEWKTASAENIDTELKESGNKSPNEEESNPAVQSTSFTVYPGENNMDKAVSTPEASEVSVTKVSEGSVTSEPEAQDTLL